MYRFLFVCFSSCQDVVNWDYEREKKKKKSEEAVYSSRSREATTGSGARPLNSELIDFPSLHRILFFTGILIQRKRVRRTRCKPLAVLDDATAVAAGSIMYEVLCELMLMWVQGSKLSPESRDFTHAMIIDIVVQSNTDIMLWSWKAMSSWILCLELRRFHYGHEFKINTQVMPSHSTIKTAWEDSVNVTEQCPKQNLFLFVSVSGWKLDSEDHSDLRGASVCH